MGDNVVVLDQGVMVESGTPQTLYEALSHATPQNYSVILRYLRALFMMTASPHHWVSGPNVLTEPTMANGPVTLIVDANQLCCKPIVTAFKLRISIASVA